MGFIRRGEVEEVAKSAKIWEMECLAITMEPLIRKKQLVTAIQIEQALEDYQFGKEIEKILYKAIGNYEAQLQLVRKMQETILKKISAEEVTDEEICMLSNFFSEEDIKELKTKKDKKIVKLAMAVFLGPYATENCQGENSMLEKLAKAYYALIQ